ncbi:retrovirus-related pol polyprotein from transposon TNT 1-94 [Tanacetum coccineum]
MAVPISTKEHKRIVNQSVATPIKRTIALESTNQKPRHITRKLYEHVSKTCSWWYHKFTPFRYKWKPKSPIGNVKTNVSMPLENASRTANILEPMTLREMIFSIGHVAIDTVYNHSSRHITPTCQESLIKAKASSSQAWLGHRRLSHLNFDTINLLLKYDIVTGLPKLKFVESINGKKYLDYFLRSKDETPKVLIDFLRLVQRGLHAQAAEIVTTSNELDLLFSPMFDELLNRTTQVVSKSSVVTTADVPNQCQQQHTTPSTSTTVVVDTPPLNFQTTPKTTSQAPTQVSTVTAIENINQGKTK